MLLQLNHQHILLFVSCVGIIILYNLNIENDTDIFIYKKTKHLRG